MQPGTPKHIRCGRQPALAGAMFADGIPEPCIYTRPRHPRLPRPPGVAALNASAQSRGAMWRRIARLCASVAPPSVAADMTPMGPRGGRRGLRGLVGEGPDGVAEESCVVARTQAQGERAVAKKGRPFPSAFKLAMPWAWVPLLLLVVPLLLFVVLRLGLLLFLGALARDGRRNVGTRYGS